MALHEPLRGEPRWGACKVGCGCERYQYPEVPPRDAVRLAAEQSLSHLRLSIGALRDVERGEDENTGTSAAYWRQKLEVIADLLESDLKGLR